jgi:hypothetical protein
MSDKKPRVIHCMVCDQPFPEKMEKHPPYFGQIKLFIAPTVGGACDRMEEISVLLTRLSAVQEALIWLAETDCDGNCFYRLYELSKELCDESIARLNRAMNKLAGLIDPNELRAELGLEEAEEEHPNGQEAAGEKEN